MDSGHCILIMTETPTENERTLFTTTMQPATNVIYGPFYGVVKKTGPLYSNTQIKLHSVLQMSKPVYSERVYNM